MPEGSTAITVELLLKLAGVLALGSGLIVTFFKIGAFIKESIKEREQAILGPIEKLRTESEASFTKLRLKSESNFKELQEGTEALAAKLEEVSGEVIKVQSSVDALENRMEQELYPLHEPPVGQQVRKNRDGLAAMKAQTDLLPAQLTAIGRSLDVRLDGIEKGLTAMKSGGTHGD
jgi:hypothetical protein